MTRREQRRTASCRFGLGACLPAVALLACAGSASPSTGRGLSAFDAGSDAPAGTAARGGGTAVEGSGGTAVPAAGPGGSGGMAGTPRAGSGSAAPPVDAGVPRRDSGAPMSPSAPDAAVEHDAGTTTDPLSTDRDVFFGASRCAAAGVRLCEDFEARNAGDGPDPARWSVFGAAPKVDDTRAARGQKSLHVHTDGNGASLIRETMTFPAEGNAFYGRMFVWFTALPTAPQWAHWTIVAATGSGNDSEVRVGGQWDGTRNRWGTGTDHGPTGDWTRLDEGDDSTAVPPAGKWLCVEWLYDGQADEVRFYLDGVEHETLHVTATDHGGSSAPFQLPELDELGLGWWLYQSNPTPAAYDVWIDEIAIDGERIGCLR